MKKIILIAFLFIATVTWSALLIPTANAQEKPTLLWKIEGNGLKKPSYLFGTLHSANPTMISENPRFREILYQVDAIAKERIEDTAYLNHWSRDAYNTQHLSKLLSQEDYEYVARSFLYDAKYDLNRLPPYSPILLMEDFIQSPKPNHEIDTTYPILTSGKMEEAFVSAAKQRHIPLYGLETFREQDSMNYKVTPPREQAIYLLNYIKEYKKGHNWRDMKQCYIDEDLNCLCKAETHHDVTSYDSVMSAGRNKNWMKRIPAMIQKQSTFIAVGAGHLCGDNGLVALLRKQGYTLTPLKAWNP